MGVSREKLKAAMIITFILEIVCCVMLIIGKFTFYQFVTSITLLDILAILERKELKEMESMEGEP